MKLTWFATFISIVAVVTLLGSCMPINQPTPFPVSRTSPTETSLVDNLKSTGTPIPTITFTDTQISTFTPEPTLPADLAYVRMSELLKNGPDCRLPCWWEIMPGHSTLLDLNAQFTTFSNIATNIYFPDTKKHPALDGSGTFQDGAIEIIYSMRDVSIQMIFYYYALNNSNEITMINISTQALPQNLIGRVYGDSAYTELLAAYTLPGILSTYGKPDQIFITADIYEYEAQAPDFLQIRLLYPKMGIFVRYTAPAEISGNYYISCPAKAFIDLWLIATDQENDYQSILPMLSSDWQGFFPLSPFNKTIEEAFGMTIDEFYSTYSSPTNRCFETPISIWPRR